MKKLLFVSCFLFFDLVLFSQTTDPNKPQLAAESKKDTTVSLANNTPQLQIAEPTSPDQKKNIGKQTGATNQSEGTPILSESSEPKKK